MSNFFTRPDLDDRQFRQESGSTLNLFGTTNFDGILKSKNVEIDATATGSSNGDILVFNGSKIILEPNTGSLYTGATPSNIEVGGIPKFTPLTGRTISEILQQMLVTVFQPQFVAPSVTLTENVSNTQEVGTTSTITYTANFDRGQITVDGNFQDFRSGEATGYTFTGISADTVITTANTAQLVLNDYVIQLGNNIESVEVFYEEGPQPEDSNGDPTGSTLSAGSVSDAAPSINGIYPYFYGTFSSGGAAPGGNRPDEATDGQTLINGGTKVVASSDGTITIDFNSTSDDYIWFATPDTSTVKTEWFIDALNNGVIGGGVSPGGNLFPSPTVVSINSPSSFWSGVNYKVYISNYQSEVTDPMELRN